MKYFISYPTSLDGVNIKNDNIDVCLNMEDGTSYTFVVFTIENLKDLMKKDGVPYCKPCYPFLIVEEITRKNIEQLVEELIEAGDLFLKIYGTNFLIQE